MNREDKIDLFMDEMGFRKDNANGKEGIYTSVYFGNDIVFDLSASGHAKWQVMTHIFNVAVKYGENQKLKEIQTTLGINQ